MTTPEHPETPPLTRKQLREIRNTGATPVIDAEAAAAAAQEQAAAADDAPVAPPPVESSLAPVAPLARPAEPVVLHDTPVPDRSVDLGVAPLTRRQARQQERIRTASVPVITPDLAAAFHAESPTPTTPADAEAEVDPQAESGPETPESAEDPFAALGVTSETEEVVLEETDHEPADSADQEAEVVDAEVVDAHDAEDESPDAAHDGSDTESAGTETAGAEESGDERHAESDVVGEGSTEAFHDEEADAPRVVAPDFGAALLSGTTVGAASVPSSFDDLLVRSASGSVATPNALILSQSPDSGPIVAPLTATGEVLITGSLNLPEGLGSTGHAPGTADGKEVDAVLVDGELPAHSSPTPIAASSAISTTKAPGEIIRPPAPEKGGRLMLTLAITAGVLALALVGVLVLAFATGVF